MDVKGFISWYEGEKIMVNIKGKNKFSLSLIIMNLESLEYFRRKGCVGI